MSLGIRAGFAAVFARSSGSKVSFAHKGTACTQIASLGSMRRIKGSAIWKRRKNQEINGGPKS